MTPKNCMLYIGLKSSDMLGREVCVLGWVGGEKNHQKLLDVITLSKWLCNFVDSSLLTATVTFNNELREF